MPVIKSAKKKLRQDKKRTLQNQAVKEAFVESVKKAKKSPNAESLRLATRAIDKAAKHHLIHRNKAARIKSALSKLLAGKTPKKTEPKAETQAKKTASKTSPTKKTSSRNTPARK